LDSQLASSSPGIGGFIGRHLCTGADGNGRRVGRKLAERRRS